MTEARRAETTSDQVEVRRVTTARDRRRFLEFPYTLYRGHPHWVPQLRIAQKDILNTKKHPFYKTSDAEKFLAYRGGRVVGRVMAILNHAHNDYHDERAGFFGFFDVENDAQAATKLIGAASDWLKSRGASLLRGPVNPSTNYECGLLVEGFDLDPAVMMPYNPAYYLDLLEQCGLRKAVDLYAYSVSVDSYSIAGKLKRVSDRLKKKDGIRVRPVNLKDFKNEVEIVRRVYNNAWSRNWGFVPVTDEEFEHLGKDLKQIVDPRVVLIAERTVEGAAKPEPIGFFLAVPDINRALKKAGGRLLPLGLLKLLWYSRKIDTIRIITMGIIKEYQSLGAASVFYDEIYRAAPASGFPKGEMSWVLENNELMVRAAQLLGGVRTKTYRIFEMQI